MVSLGVEMDAYSELGLERKLGLSDETVRGAFRAVGKSRHPDGDGGGDVEGFSRLQEAMRVLLDPAARLRCWLELEGVAGELRGAISNDLMEVFSQVGGVLQRADALIRERDGAESALAKALLEGRVQGCREELEEVQQGLAGMVAERVVRFEGIEAGEVDGWEVARDLAFLAKWEAQVAERFGGLW